MLAALFRLSLRSTQGFVQSLLKLLKLPLSCPHYTTLSRRAATLKIALPVRSTSEPIHVVVDSTGLKVYGEGEWKVRMHGYGCRRTWRKLHVGVNEATGEIVSSELTSSKTHDSEVLSDLLNHIENPLTQVTADGAYDAKTCYQAIEEHSAIPVIPPCKNAQITPKGHPTRHAHIQRIEKIGRAEWKKETHYHRRSLAETTMSRLKRLLGPQLAFRKFGNQQTEASIKCFILNQMIQLAKPVSVPI